jgi:hypothetical protein
MARLLLAVQEWLTKDQRSGIAGITPDDQFSLPATAHLVLPETSDP